MNIVGDQLHSKFFYVKNDDGSLRWVDSLDIAKYYVSDSANRNWYDKTLYCTNESICKGYDDKYYLASELPAKPEEMILHDTLLTFDEQSEEFIHSKLEEYARKRGFFSFLELISWIRSSITKNKKLATLGLKYRDLLYTRKYIHLDMIKNKFVDINDISEVYTSFLKDFPEE